MENKFINTGYIEFVLKNAQKGDEEAWKKLFNWHFRPVYHYCLTLASGRQDVAEEITQQVFVTAACRITRFNSKRGTFRAWLLGIARKHFIKFESKEIRRKWYETQFYKKSIKKKGRTSPLLLVHESLACLPQHYQLLLEAKYLEKLTVKQIAKSQGRTIKATESLLNRAREKFRQIHSRIQD